ncbi:MAG: hypothetical protein ACM3SY_16145 [Candidatus Omnitrophota bacterium]
MKTYRLAILKNETEEDHLGWVRACGRGEYDIDFEVIDITKENWLDRVAEPGFDCMLVQPPCSMGHFKQLVDERLYIIHSVLGRMIYPSLEETLIYENKRMLAYWLQANRVPHPRTWIFYDKMSAENFASHCPYPLVAKTALGASGSGVRILRHQRQALEYINRSFSDRGIIRKWGINLRRGDLLARSFSRLKDVLGFIRYMNAKKKSARRDPQQWHVIFQEYVPDAAEWRCVRIGDSFFGHQKLARGLGELKSGTSRVSWDPPPIPLLNFVYRITEKRHFLSQSADIFEDRNGHYLVNELQAFWGSKNPHQMIVDGKPGRFVQKNNQWVFEEGDFNSNNSYDLRLRHVIDILREKNK